MTTPVIRSVEHRLSRWVTLIEKWVQWPGRSEAELYHAFSQSDYVSVLAISTDGRIPLVRQFRPVCGEYTLEFPGGMVEPDESPESCARRELLEEAGCTQGELLPLGVLWPDPGRLTNRLHCFIARDVAVLEAGWSEESGLERYLIDGRDLSRLVAGSRLCNAHHVALVGLAQAAGFLSS